MNYRFLRWALGVSLSLAYVAYISLCAYELAHAQEAPQLEMQLLDAENPLVLGPPSTPPSPTPSASPTPEVPSTPGASPTPTMTPPIPTPEPTPEQECKLFSLHRSGLAYQTGKHHKGGNQYAYSTASGDALELQCVKQLLPLGRHYIASGFNATSDVGLVKHIANQACSGPRPAGWCKAWRGNPYNVSLYMSFTAYFDRDCNFVMNPTPEQLESLCGGVGVHKFWRGSPISFFWETDVDPNTEISYVQFPLDPTKSGRWYEWKASGKSPLLVYDPSRTGKITTAFQLFGNWTFSGWKNASLSTSNRSDSPTSLGGKWDHGYEPLALMDSNRDGEISGAELDSLSLWFDYNRDAVSQAGEVKTLAEVGVTRVFYKPDYRDPESGSVYASVGYERVLRGERIIGKSVDWFGRGAGTQEELFQYAQSKSALCETATVSKKTRAANQDEGSENLIASHGSDTLIKLQGLWVWKLKESLFTNAAGIGEQGILELVGAGDGKIVGATISEVAISHEELKSVLSVESVSGSITKIREGLEELYFGAHGKDAGQLSSYAKYYHAEDELHGVTTERVFDGKKYRTIRYAWIAHRLH